jgi:hypothetical protein
MRLPSDFVMTLSGDHHAHPSGAEHPLDPIFPGNDVPHTDGALGVGLKHDSPAASLHGDAWALPERKVATTAGDKRGTVS